MNIYAAGIDYKTAPLEVREKLGLTRQEQKTLLQQVKARGPAAECVVVSTCNRMEIYACTDGLEPEPADAEAMTPEGRKFCESLVRLVCEGKGLDSREFEGFFKFYGNSAAVVHLFRVTAGLESQVLGEDQILGQVKTAHEAAQEEGTGGSVLNTLFREAVTTAKKIKTCTELSKNPVSTASLAVKLIEEWFGGSLAGRKALIIGAGRIGMIAVENLLAKGVGKVYATKRLHPGGRAAALTSVEAAIPEKSNDPNFERAEGYPADQGREHGLPAMGGTNSGSIKIGETAVNPQPASLTDQVEIVDYNERYRYIAGCDIVISATESPHYTITREELERVLGDAATTGMEMVRAGSEPGLCRKVFVDLAVPRDIESTIAGLEGIRHFTIDDLKLASDENLEKRAEEALKAEGLIAEAAGEFEKWLEYREAVPVIREIRRFADEVVENRTGYVSGKLKNAGAEELGIVKASMAGAVNEVLNKLVFSIRECGTKEDIQSYFRCLREVILADGDR